MISKFSLLKAGFLVLQIYPYLVGLFLNEWFQSYWVWKKISSLSLWVHHGWFTSIFRIFLKKEKKTGPFISTSPTRPLKSCCFFVLFIFNLPCCLFISVCVAPIYMDLHKSRDCLCDLFGSLPSLPHLSQIVFELS